MEGSTAVIEVLNEILTAELTAINQYFVHSKMCGNWGYERLQEAFRHESIDEMRDADALIGRILFLDGVPNVQRLFPISIGETVAEQLHLDRELELAAIERYNRGIALCVEAGDHGSRELLAHQLVGEEEHMDWIETQLEAIRQIGIENYLSQQLRG